MWNESAGQESYAVKRKESTAKLSGKHHQQTVMLYSGYGSVAYESGNSDYKVTL